MALFPPQVIVPLSECSSQIHLQGQLTHSVVIVLADGVEIAGGEATGPDQWFQLRPGARLAPGAKITAVQDLGGERSAPSPDPVIVQARPRQPGPAIFDPRQHLWVGAQCIRLIGMVPGATVTVESLEGIYTAQADDGTAVVGRKPLAPEEIMKAHQTACGTDGPPNLSVKPEQLPPGLYSTRLSLPLSACQTQVTVEQAAEGGIVFIERQSETLSACFPISNEFLDLDIPLQEHEDLHLQVEVPGATGPGDAGHYQVGPQPPEPAIVGHLCAGATRILIRGLTRRQQVSLLQDGNNLGTFESPGSSYAVPVPPLTPGAHFRIQYEFCGMTNITKQEWVVEAAPASITVPVIPAGSLTECSTSVLVTRVEAGAYLQIFSEQLGGQIGDGFAMASSAVISVAPALSTDDKLIARQSACGHVNHSGPTGVLALGDLPLPIIQPPPIEGARSVTVTQVVPGAAVDLYVNGFAGSAVAESTSVVVPILAGHPELILNQKVNAQQRLCTVTSVGPTVDVQPMPPNIVLFQAMPQEIEPGQSSTLAWQTFGADAVKVVDENGHLVVTGQPNSDQKPVRPSQTTTYTLLAEHAGAETRSHPVTVTVHITPPPPHTQTATQTIELFQQPIFEGSIPYISTFPPIGFITGNLQKISIPSPEPGITSVSFVKLNHSTLECGSNPDAVITLTPGQSTTPTMLTQLFGAASPAFPVHFTACIAIPLGQPVPTNVAITITYTYAP